MKKISELIVFGPEVRGARWHRRQGKMDSQECNAGIETKSSARRSALAAGLLATTAIVLCSYPLQSQPAVAQTATQGAAVRAFNIPAQPLAGALNAFGRQSGLQVTLAAATTRGVNSRPVNGSFTAQQALAQMLEGTGIPFRITSDRTAVVGASQAAGNNGGAMPAGAIALDTIDVQGAGNPNSTMTPPPAYAGGQVATGGQVGILGNRNFMNTPFSQSNYTAQLVQNQQARYLSEALNNDPSVVANDARTSGTNIITIRGFLVPTNSVALFNGLQGVAPVVGDATALTEPFERIEVLKGSSSLLNGIVGNVGGSINFVPKRAGDAPLTQFTPDYRMNSQFGGHVDVGRRFGDNKEFGMRFNGVYRDGNTTVDHQSIQTALATLGLDYRGERLRADGDFGYQKAKVQGIRRVTNMAAGVQVPEAPDNRTNWFHPAEFLGTEVLYGSLRGEFDVTDRLTAFAAFGGSELFQTRFTPNRLITSVLGTVAGGNFPGDASLNKTDSITWQTGLRARLETGFVQHQIVFAYNSFEQTTRNSLASGAPGTPRPTSNIYNPIYGAWPSFLTPSFGDTRRARDITQSSFAVADTLSILEERVQLTIGGRAQQIKAGNFNTASGVATSRYDENAISPSIALVVKPLQNVSIYGNYIQGLQQGPIAPQGAANEGQVFAPYSAEQYETGVKVDFGSLAATVALYQIANPSTYTDPSTNVFGINGDQRNRGIELNLFGEVATGIRVLGGVSYIDSVLLNTAGGINDGNRGLGVPQWRGVFGAEWDPPFIPGFTLTGRVIRNDSVFVDQANLQRIPAWTRLDIGARYRIERSGGQPIVIRAGIDNVLNSSHWESPGSDFMFLSEPRAFKLSASFNF